MRVLLSDGSGLTARQVVTQLTDAGHTVDVLSSDPLCLARFTRRVRRVHRVPPYGTDPLRWLNAALGVFHMARMDVLLPTQEQVAVFSAMQDFTRGTGVRTVVPPFAALTRVQDKLSAFATLTSLGLPQPEGAILAKPTDIAAWNRFPVFMKMPIGTASTAVRIVRHRAGLLRVVQDAEAAGAFRDGGVLAQAPAKGPLVMVQSIFGEGGLVAFHANLRVREGAGGGASHKRSVDLPAVREQMTDLGRQLHWHGALSADAIMTREGPSTSTSTPASSNPATPCGQGWTW